MRHTFLSSATWLAATTTAAVGRAITSQRKGSSLDLMTDCLASYLLLLNTHVGSSPPTDTFLVARDVDDMGWDGRPPSPERATLPPRESPGNRLCSSHLGTSQTSPSFPCPRARASSCGDPDGGGEPKYNLVPVPTDRGRCGCYTCPSLSASFSFLSSLSRVSGTPNGF